MSAARRAVQRHYFKNPFRYVVAHFDLNRAQRRSGAKRDAHTGKLLTPPGHNVPYLSGEYGLKPWQLGDEGQELTDA